MSVIMIIVFSGYILGWPFHCLHPLYSMAVKTHRQLQTLFNTQ